MNETGTRLATVAVAADTSSNSVIEAAKAFGERHGLAHVGTPQAADAEYVLAFTDTCIELREAADRKARGFAVDFSTIDLRTGAGNLSRKQPLARAIGRETRSVVDATAGLGHDAVLLACIGYEVTAIERSPVIAALLEDGVRRAGEDPALAAAIGGRLLVLTGDARSILDSLVRCPEVIFVDPMFPEKRRKSALARKHIRLVRAIVGDDPDAAALVETARERATKRVVVKRPRYASPLAGTPDLAYGGKLARYDVYLT